MGGLVLETNEIKNEQNQIDRVAQVGQHMEA